MITRIKLKHLGRLNFDQYSMKIDPRIAVGEPPISTALKSVVAKAVPPSPPKAL
jgi:hypothetical protein